MLSRAHRKLVAPPGTVPEKGDPPHCSTDRCVQPQQHSETEAAQVQAVEQVTQEASAPTAAALPTAVCHVADCEQVLEPDTDANYCLQCKLWLCENCRDDTHGQHDPATHTLVLWAERETAVERAACCLSASVAMQALEYVRESSVSAGTAETAPSLATAASTAGAVPARSPAAAVVTADDLVRVLERLGGQCSKAKLADALRKSASREGKRTPLFDVVLTSALRSRLVQTDASSVFLKGAHRSTGAPATAA